MLKISTEKWIACVIKRSGSCFEWNWDNCRTAFRRSYCFGFISIAFTVKSKKLNSKITKHEETISLAEAKHLPFGRLFSEAVKEGSISDVEFDLILREIEQYYLLKNQPIKFPPSPIPHYAFSSWAEKTLTKTIHCHRENKFVLQKYGAVRKFYRPAWKKAIEVDVEAIKNQIRDDYRKKKIRITRKHNVMRFIWDFSWMHRTELICISHDICKLYRLKIS